MNITVAGRTPPRSPSPGTASRSMRPMCLCQSSRTDSKYHSGARAGMGSVHAPGSGRRRFCRGAEGRRHRPARATHAWMPHGPEAGGGHARHGGTLGSGSLLAPSVLDATPVRERVLSRARPPPGSESEGRGRGNSRKGPMSLELHKKGQGVIARLAAYVIAGALIVFGAIK